LLLAFEKF